MERSRKSYLPGGGIHKVTVFWFLIGTGIGAACGAFFAFIFNSTSIFKRHDDTTIPDLRIGSDDLSELIGKIQHVTSTNIDTLEKKISELRVTVHLANEIYMKLNEEMSDTMNEMAKNHEENKENDKTFSKYDDISNNVNVKSSTKEEKVIELRKKGWTPQKIAESLDIGIGEVNLIIQINSKEEDEDG
jgi:transcriptional regulator